MKKLLAVALALALTVSAVSPAVLAAETLATQQTETSARENMQKILESVNGKEFCFSKGRGTKTFL